MESVVVIGAGGHTRSLMSLIDESNNYMILGIFDDSFAKFPNEVIGTASLIGSIADIQNSSAKMIVSIGDNIKRKRMVSKFSERVLVDNIIAGSAIIRKDVKIGVANQIFEQAFINAGVLIGDFCVINSKALMEHESIIGNYCHVAVGAIICGRVTIGDNCMIGAGSIIKDRVSIVSDVIIGAGAVVIKDIKSSGTYIGNPLRKIK